MIWKLATLLRKKDSLDVCVELEEFEEKKDVKSIIPNGPDQTVMGSIAFCDERLPQERLRDFIHTFQRPMVMETSRDGSYIFARYGSHFEPTIPHAFVTYFSDFAKRVVNEGQTGLFSRRFV